MISNYPNFAQYQALNGFIDAGIDDESNQQQWRRDPSFWKRTGYSGDDDDWTWIGSGQQPGAYVPPMDRLVQELFPSVYRHTIDGESQWGGANAAGAMGVENWASMFDQMAGAQSNGMPGLNLSQQRREEIIRRLAADSPNGTVNYDQMGKYLTPQENQALYGWVDSVNQQNADKTFGDYLAQAAFALGTSAIGGAAFGMGPIAEASGTLGSGGLFGASSPISNLAGAGYTDAASLGSGLNDVIGGASSGAGEFGLSGATAGNLAGTGGLSSAAGINGIGEGLGTGGLGLGSGAAGAAAQGVGSSSLLSPSLAASAGLGAAGIGASGGGSLLGGSTAAAAPSAAAGMGGAAAAAPAITAGSALSRFIDGTATTADYTQLLGGVAGSALGMYGANEQADAYKDVANKFLDMGQPYRDRLNASYAPGFSMANQPDFMNALDLGSESVLRKLSATGGNPYGNAGAMAEANKYVSGALALPQLNTYRSQLGTFGQLGTNQAGSAMGAQTQAQGSKYDALGYGIGQLTQPDNPFKGLLDQFKYKPSNGWGY